MATTQQLEMHIRVKRKDVVLFLYVDPSETVRDVKNKVEALLGQPVAGQRLLKGDVVLDSDGSKLADLNIDYDDELFLVYKLHGDSWEDVDIATKSDVKQEQ